MVNMSLCGGPFSPTHLKQWCHDGVVFTVEVLYIIFISAVLGIVLFNGVFFLAESKSITSLSNKDRLLREGATSVRKTRDKRKVKERVRRNGGFNEISVLESLE